MFTRVNVTDPSLTSTSEYPSVVPLARWKPQSTRLRLNDDRISAVREPMLAGSEKLIVANVVVTEVLTNVVLDPVTGVSTLMTVPIAAVLIVIPTAENVSSTLKANGVWSVITADEGPGNRVV